MIWKRSRPVVVKQLILTAQRRFYLEAYRGYSQMDETAIVVRLDIIFTQVWIRVNDKREFLFSANDDVPLNNCWIVACDTSAIKSQLFEVPCWLQ